MVTQLDALTTPLPVEDHAAHQAQNADETLCTLCGLHANRPIWAELEGTEYAFCCYGCRHIYELVAPQLAQGVALPVAMGQAGLDLNAPCCRGIIHGDPAKAANSLLSRLMFTAILSMMVMAVSFALYSDFFFTWDESGAGLRSLLQVLAMLFATPVVLLLAVPILEDAVLTFQVYHRLTTSALIAMGTLAAYGLSVYATFTGQGHTYFETATMTLVLVTLGRWLDARTQVEGNHALDALITQAPTEVSLLHSDGQEARILATEVQVGHRIRVRPGENFAVDGCVLWGEGSVNEANISGEFAPAYKGTGDQVYAGTINLDGSFDIEATHVGEDRVMGKLVKLLDEARLHRSSIERLADQVAGYFVPLVMLLALGTFVYWGWYSGLAKGLMTSLAVLLIACPCALGVATPLTIWIALGRAARRGILIRESMTLEKLARVRHLFFDKTGTLTTGESKLTDIRKEPAETATVERLLQMAASVDQASEHPVAVSIVQTAKAQKIALLPLETFQALPGLGVIGVIEGCRIRRG